MIHHGCGVKNVQSSQQLNLGETVSDIVNQMLSKSSKK
jgi:hypothetical protein